MTDNLVRPFDRRRALTIDDLSDDDLLGIFDFYVVRYQDMDDHLLDEYLIRKIESWQSLVHVCRRWRGLVFGSPRRLNLQICVTYTAFGSAMKSLDVWPALPLLIFGSVFRTSTDSTFASRLEHSDRICHIDLACSAVLQKFWTAVQVPFPELKVLTLSYGGQSDSEEAPVLPDSFLGGSAPRLRSFYLDAIPFPGLPKLLLSSTHLVDLNLHNIPLSGYISPETMTTCLSMLSNLETLRLEFESPLSFPDLKSRHPLPPTRSVLPSLTIFGFKGLSEYSEEFVARIDTPRLYQLLTEFFDDIGFDTPELTQFISRMPTLGAYDEARIVFYTWGSQVRLSQSHPEPSDHTMVEVKISCLTPDRVIPSLVQVCTSSLRLLLTMENLYIDGSLSFPRDLPVLVGDSKSTECLDLLRPFTAVKKLYLSKLFSRPITLALQELTGGRTTEVLPALSHIILDGYHPSKPIKKIIAKFISARQLTNHPVNLIIGVQVFGGR